MQPETEAGLSQLIVEEPLAASEAEAAGNGADSGHVSSEIGRNSGSLYNLVKALAKEGDFDLAVGKLKASAIADVERVNVKNSKGSTALHACGYLRRWDMALVLLAAGADPLVRNAAGHSFFLTAVRDGGAPWEALFAGHPDLLSKHRKFLEKESRGPQRGPREVKGDTQSLVPRPPRASVPDAEVYVPESSAMSDSFESGEWSRFIFESGSARFDASSKAISCLVNSGPIGAVDLSIARGLRFNALDAEAICLRAVAEGWAAQGQLWVLVGKYLTPSIQRKVLARAIREEQFITVQSLARAGWSYDEAIIEGLEDAGACAVADALIDLQSMPPAPINGPVVTKLGGGTRSTIGKVAKSKRARKGAGGQGVGRRPKADKRASSMIANLDRPSREASDFEYKERQPQARAPLIIVKKARTSIIPPSL